MERNKQTHKNTKCIQANPQPNESVHNQLQKTAEETSVTYIIHIHQLKPCKAYNIADRFPNKLNMSECANTVREEIYMAW